MIEIHFDSYAVSAAFSQITRRTADKPKLMRTIAGIMFDEVEENFEQQGRPRWPEIKSVSLARAGYTQTKTGKWAYRKRDGGPGYKILQDSGRLAGSITQYYDATQAVVGTNMVYAAIHQFGGKTKAHTIRAKNARALALPGIGPRRSVQHPGSVIPARPYLVVSDAGWARIARAGEDFLRQLQP